MSNPDRRVFMFGLLQIFFPSGTITSRILDPGFSKTLESLDSASFFICRITVFLSLRILHAWNLIWITKGIVKLKSIYTWSKTINILSVYESLSFLSIRFTLNEPRLMTLMSSSETLVVLHLRTDELRQLQFPIGIFVGVSMPWELSPSAINRSSSRKVDNATEIPFRPASISSQQRARALRARFTLEL